MAYNIQGSVIINDSRELVNVGTSTISALTVTTSTTTGNLTVNGTVDGTAGILTTGSLAGILTGDVSIGDSLTADSAYITNDVQLGGNVNGPENLIIDPSPLGGIGGTVTIRGDLVVEGTEFIVDSETVLIADKQIGLATNVTTDLLLDGAGFAVGEPGSAVEKFFVYRNSTEVFESSIGLGVTAGDAYKIGSDDVLSAGTLGATILASSLTSVGTLTDLTVAGDINANGNIVGDTATNISGINSVTATEYYGDGSNLTGVGLNTSNFYGVGGIQAGILTVTGDATLGTSALDDITLNGSIASNITPDGDGTRFLGADGAAWANIYGFAADLGGGNTSGIGLTVSNNIFVGGAATLDDGLLAGFIGGTPNLVVPNTSGISVAIGTDLTLGGGVGSGLSVTAGAFYGDGSSLTGIGLTSTEFYVVGGVQAGVATVTGDITANGNIVGDTATNISGINSVTATDFYGDGSNLTGISADAADSILVADNQDNTDYPMIFASAVGAGASIYSDSTTSFEFTYNPSTGTATAATFDSVSDERLKDNIKLITDPVAKLAVLRGVEFDWKGIEGSSVGVIAQDVAKVYPQLVTDHGERLTVNYDGLVGLLVRAVQELTARVEELESK